jgi:hypothetical protein
MRDWRTSKSLSEVLQSVGFSMSDVADISGLDESTVCRLWNSPEWLDRISGRSLQCLIASVPGVDEYFAEYALLARRKALVTGLEAEGISVNEEAIEHATVAHQHLLNALELALYIMQGDAGKVCSYVARFWGRDPDHALGTLYSTNPMEGLLGNPERLSEATVALVPRLTRKSYSFHSILAIAILAHHVGKSTGTLSGELVPSTSDRGTAFMTRSGIMGLLIRSNDFDLADRYRSTLAKRRVLALIEQWAFPTWTRDSRLSSDFTLPGSLLLRNTAIEILREFEEYNDAYVYYLMTTCLPLALERDPTFGLRVADLQKSIERRRDGCQEARFRKACDSLGKQLSAHGVTAPWPDGDQRQSR